MKRSARRFANTFLVLCLGLATFGVLIAQPTAASAANAADQTITGAATAGSDTSTGAEAGKKVQPTTMHVNLSASAKKTSKASSAAPSFVQGASFTSPTADFDGIDGSKGDLPYPDEQIDVGPEHVVETISGWLAVFDKSGTLLGDTSIPDFFATTNTDTACSPQDEDAAARMHDSSVMYDTLSDRWFVVTNTSDDESTGPYYTCIAASTTGNPLDTDWNVYAVKVFGQGDLYPNNFKFGLWSDGLYMAADIDCVSVSTLLDCPFSSYISDGEAFSFVGAQVWGFNRSDLLDGSALRWQTTAGANSRNSNCTSATSGSITFNSCFFQELHVASFRKQTGVPPAGRGVYFMDNDCPWGLATGLSVWRWDVNWDNPASSVITLPMRVGNGTCNGSIRPDIPAPVGNALYSNLDYLTGHVQYVNLGGNEALWSTHGYDNGSGTTLRMRAQWSRFGITSATGNLTTTGTGATTWTTGSNSGQNYSDDNLLDRWDPSLAVDSSGNATLAYSTMNARTTDDQPVARAGIRYTGRLAGDPAGTMPQAETLLHQGPGYQVGSIDGVTNDSFGLSSQTVLDPDGCTFWHAGEYFITVPGEGGGGGGDAVPYATRIGAWGFPSANCTPQLLATNLAAKGSAASVGADTGTLKATLKATGTSSGIGGKTIDFTLGGDPVGSAVTDSDGVATLSSVDVSTYSIGTAPGDVGASFAGTPNTYDTSTTTGDLKIFGNTPQVITFDPLADKTFGDADFNISASSDSALDVALSAQGKCSVTGTLVHIKGAGSCTITASQEGNDFYAAATDVARTFSIAKANQSVTLAALTSGSVGTPKQVTVSSALPAARTVEWSVDNANCKVRLSRVLNGAQIDNLHTGTCNVTASMPGDANYNPASSSQSYTIGKGTQTLSITPTNTTRRIDQISHLVGSSWNSGLSSSTFVAANAGPWTATSPGGNGTTAVFTLTPAQSFMQVGTRVTLSGSSVPAYDGTYTVTAIGGTNATTITVATPATGAVTTNVSQALTVCQNTGNDVKVSHTGACKFTATQDGNTDWNPGAGTVTKGITKGNQGSMTFVPGVSNHSVTDPFDATASLNSAAAVSTPELRASGLSPGALTSTTPSVCTVGSTTNNGDGTATATVTPVVGGTCTVQAAGTAASDDWAARTAQSVTYTITKASQTVAFGSLSDKHVTDGDFDVSATATSGLGVTFSSLTTDVCTVTGSTVHLTGFDGTCTIRASQDGNGFYNPAPNVDRSFQSVEPAPQTITFDQPGDHTHGDADFDPGATASSGLQVSYEASPVRVCTIVAGKVHVENRGVCTVTATQAGDFSYHSAEPVSRSFTVFAAAKLVLKVKPPKKDVPWGGDIKTVVRLSAQGRQPSGVITYSIAPAGGDPVQVGTLNYVAGRKQMTKTLTGDVPCGPANAKYFVSVTFADTVGSHQVVTLNKPKGKPIQLDAGPGSC